MKIYPKHYEMAFKSYFKQPLRRFFHPLFGFNIVRFDDAMKRIGYIEDGKTSCNDFVTSRFGNNASELIQKLLKI